MAHVNRTGSRTTGPAPVPQQRLETGPGCPDGLRRLLEAGAPILIQARVSNPAGQASYQAAVQNLVTAADKLATNRVFPSLPDLLPPRRRLAAQLRDASEVQRSEDVDGVLFENKFLTLTLPACDQVHIHLSCGSGRKVDMDSLHQPVTRHAAKYIRRVKPAVVCAAEVARWARGGWSLAPWALAVQALEEHLGEPAYLSFDGDRPKSYSQPVDFDLFSRASNAAHETHDMRARTTSAVRAMLPVVDEGGFCAYPLPFAPPPPLATAWRLVENAGLQPQQVVFIDTPAVRETLGPSIVYGLPAVHDGEGNPADQLALVRFFLTHRGRPGWTPTKLARHLADRYFSTEGTRRQAKSRSASVRVRPGNKSDIWHVMKSVEDNLEFYRTGNFYRGIGDRSGPRLVAHLMPPDGEPYLREADYTRIRTLIDENQVKYTRNRRYTFGHHPVTYDGRPGHLVAHHEDDEIVYRIRRDTPARTSRAESPTKPPRTPTRRSRLRRHAPIIPADLFALSLVQGLIAGHGDLTPFVPPPEPHIDEEHEEWQRLLTALDKKQRRRERLYARLFPEDDVPAPTGQLRIDANAEYDELHREVLDLKRDVAQASTAAERRAKTRDPRTLAVKDLLSVVASLRDPEDTEFHAQWRHAIHDLHVTVGPRREYGVLHYDTTWTGTLLIHQGTDQRALPFAGTSARPTGSPHHALEEAVTALRAGTGLLASTWNNHDRRDQLRRALGVPPGEAMPALTIRDPRLLRIAMAVVYPPAPRTRAGDPDGQDGGIPLLASPPLTPRQLPAAARRLGEPLALLKRVQATNPAAGYATGATRRWICSGDRDVNEACRLAAASDGTLYAADFPLTTWRLLQHAAKRSDKRLFQFGYGQMTLQPCPWCGSLNWLHLDIREATEPVCGHCRLDFSGIEWPADPYDQYAYGNHD